MDVHGKLHRMSKSVPVFETVAQVGETTRRSKLSLSYESDAENTPPNTLPSQNVCEPSEKPQEYMEYEFLDEAFVHPEGLGFGSSVNCASNANETHSSCANCVTSAQKREKDRRYFLDYPLKQDELQLSFIKSQTYFRLCFQNRQKAVSCNAYSFRYCAKR